MTTHRCYIATLCALLCALLPAASHAQQNERADFELGCATEILANIMREFQQGYVDKVSADKLLQAAADGLVHATDPYSEYISEESMSEFEIMTTGKYGGVGSLIRKRGEHVLFAQPYKGAPADEVGIKVGDKIVAIDGKSATSLDIAEVSARLKGEPGTEVEVVVERNIDAAIDTLRITRRRISIPSVPYSGMLRDGIGYICHNDFIDGSYDELRRSLEQLMATDSLRGLVLDYRSNGGGVMQEAVKIASLFVPRGELIVSLMGRDSSSLREFRTEQLPLAADIPIVVLVNGASASASEILAGALQDLDRAVVMGQRTFGKGLVQATRAVGYNSYLKYTMSRYYIPSGRCIQALNYAARRSDGSVERVADSLLTEYRTRGGRRVYDGGGILPDCKAEPQYVSRFALTLYAMGYLEDWADEYMRRHRGESIDVRSFSISDEDYESFKSFIADKDVPYESETRRALTQLKEAARNDLYDERLDDVIAELEAMIKDDKMSNLETYRNEIINAINADIIMRHAYNSGAVEHAAVNDKLVNMAVELLLDEEEYRRILREQDLDKE